MKTRLDDVQRIAKQAADAFMRKFWSAKAAGHEGDLMQEATISVMAAQETFDPAKGEWEQYAYRAATLAMKRYFWRHIDVVALPRPERGAKLQPRCGLGELGEFGVCHNDPHEIVANAQFNGLVRSALEKLDPSRGKMGIATALDGHTAEDAAKRNWMPVKAAYWARKNMTRRATKSDELRELWASTR